MKQSQKMKEGGKGEEEGRQKRREKREIDSFPID